MWLSRSQVWITLAMNSGPLSLRIYFGYLHDGGVAPALVDTGLFGITSPLDVADDVLVGDLDRGDDAELVEVEQPVAPGGFVAFPRSYLPAVTPLHKVRHPGLESAVRAATCVLVFLIGKPSTLFSSPPRVGANIVPEAGATVLALSLVTKADPPIGTSILLEQTGHDDAARSLDLKGSPSHTVTRISEVHEIVNEKPNESGCRS